MKFILITGRDIHQGITKDRKLSQDYLRGTAICKLNPRDLMELGIRDGDRVKVSTQYGWVVVSAKSDPNMRQGYGFIPLGIWASFLMGSDTKSTGMPQLKGIQAEIEPTSQPVSSIKELIQRATMRSEDKKR